MNQVLVEIQTPVPADFRDFSENMRRVLKLHKRARAKLDDAATHALRVALRSCVSACDGLRELDDHPAWAKMRKAARALFNKLGELRDLQVLCRWVRKLSAVRDAASRRLLRELDLREKSASRRAARAVRRFSRSQWRSYQKVLSRRARLLPPGDLACGQLALQRWIAADQLHFRALEKRTRGAYHKLRIAIKRFRYTLEGFVPQLAATFNNDLRRVQDVLGEVHDLDLLDALVKKSRGVRPGARKRWRAHIEHEIQRRIDRYRKLTMGRRALFSAWRAALPGDARLHESAVAWLAAWAQFRDPRQERTARAARLALQLFDALQAARVRDPFHDEKARYKLEAAAFLHLIENTPKRAARRIRELEAPIGWSRFEMDYVADIVRRAGGARSHPARRPQDQRQAVARLAGVLRLALALERSGVDGLSVEVSPEAIVVRTEGINEHAKEAREIAPAKKPLEAALDRLILVRTADYALASPRGSARDDEHEEE